MDWCCQYGPNCLFKIDLCWITYVVDYLKKWMSNIWMCQYGCLHGSCWIPVADNPRFPMDFVFYNVPVTSFTQSYISGRPLGSGWTAALTLKSKMKHEQGRIHGYRSRVRVGRGHIWGHQTIWAGAVRSENKIHKKSKMWPTDQPTDKAGCRVACTRLKKVVG